VTSLLIYLLGGAVATNEGLKDESSDPWTVLAYSIFWPVVVVFVWIILLFRGR
jgi:hypothetical protein